jgi:hypothetical protein
LVIVTRLLKVRNESDSSAKMMMRTIRAMNARPSSSSDQMSTSRPNPLRLVGGVGAEVVFCVVEAFISADSRKVLLRWLRRRRS